jgi:hypothetical protein
MAFNESEIPREVQCQASRRYLPERPAEGETVECPWCREHETYLRVAASGAAALVVASAVALCRREFGVDDDGIKTAVWLGQGPETVYESKIQRYNIYLARDSDPWQLRYSAGHEPFHRVCSPGVGGHWGDELFAVLFSLVFLKSIGEKAHAERNERELINEADVCCPQDFFSYSGGPLPGMYGRAFLVGRDLLSVVGRESAQRLAVTRGIDGRVDADAWLAGLPSPQRALVPSILQP